MFMGSIDLKDTYFLVPIRKSHRKFLRFVVNTQIYEFICLPFGLSSSPLVFTKIMKLVMNNLRSRGFVSVIYLDDTLCMGENRSTCQSNIQTTCELLEALDFVINEKKSKLQPERTLKYLGFILDSKKMSVELPLIKKSYLFTQICSALNKKSCSIRDFIRFIGLLVAGCLGVEYDMIYSKSLEKTKLH